MRKSNLKLRNKYQSLEHLKDNQGICNESHWQQVKEAWTSACNEILGKLERYHKERLSAASREKIDERGKKKTIL
jgi:hypothetical protein